MKGYKAFNRDLTCRGYQYEIGKEFEHKGEIGLCESGFHFCKRIVDIQKYYNLNNEDTRICKIEATGEIIEGEDKCVTNKIKIIKEVTKEEVYELGNEGKLNTGLGNTGNWNTGNRNTGNSNTGNWNTGNWNTGDWNTGNSNTGNSNTGNWNTGNRNTGNSNTGNWNTGNWNTGDWNKTDRSSGVLCNKEPKLIIFNKETNMTWEEWRNSEVYYILAKNTKTQWIYYEDMTDEEKEKYPSAKTCNGYLKEIERAESSKKWWNKLSKEEKVIIIQLPNFNLDIFNDIMELEISKEEYEEILEWSKLNKEIS